MPKQVIIAGGSLASLKVASLLSATQFLGYQLTVISPNKEFAFLPLLPDLISGGIKERDCFAQLAKFCKARSIQFVQDRIQDINHKEQYLITVGQHEFGYHFLLICTGISPNGVCEQARWIETYQMILRSSSEPIRLPRPGIAEFEIISATRHLKPERQFMIALKTNERSFHSHPALGSIEQIAPELQYAERVSLQQSDGLNHRTNTSPGPEYSNLNTFLDNLNVEEAIAYNVIPLGGAYCRMMKTQSNAQFASYTAKESYVYILRLLLGWKHPSRISLAFSYKQFKSRGVMLFCGRYKSAIWFNDTVLSSRAPNVSGRLAAVMRRIFYRYQMTLFYKDSPYCRSLIYLYALFLLTRSFIIQHLPI
jgi:hypothetical protein